MLTKEEFKNTVRLLMLMLVCFPASGAVYLVTDTNDTTGIRSLRGAIIAANRVGGKNTIILGKSRNLRDRPRQWIYRLTISGANEGAALTGDLNIISGDTTIVGMNPNVTIDAAGLGDRVFQVSSNAHLTLKNITIRGGTASAGVGLFESGEFGGAIYNSGNVILEHCVITNNTSGDGQYVEGNGGGTAGGDGGGIYNSGRLRANHCVIARNSCGAGFDAGFGGNGGGIRNDGYCDLFECIINDNQAGAGGGPAGNAFGGGGYGGNGGGIFNSGALVLSECIIGGNVAGFGASGGSPGWMTYFAPGGSGGDGGSGGGIYNVGHLEINFSTVYGNYTGNGGNGGDFGIGGKAGAGGNGGGIFNSGELRSSTSTVSSNSCGNGGNGGYGGAIGGASGGAGGSGGGIYNSGPNVLCGINPGLLELASSTVTLNETGAGGNGGNSSSFDTNAASGGNSGDGGGVGNYADANAVIVRNTLIAQNLPNIGGGPGTNTTRLIGPGPQEVQVGDAGVDSKSPDVAGAFTSEGFNLIGIGDGSTGFTNGVNADKVGSLANPIDPLLGPLQMNGGFTPTHALLRQSPCVDQGKCFGVHRDQRRRHRPYVYSSISRPPGGDGSDIGAFELDTH